MTWVGPPAPAACAEQREQGNSHLLTPNPPAVGCESSPAQYQYGGASPYRFRHRVPPTGRGRTQPPDFLRGTDSSIHTRIPYARAQVRPSSY